MIAFSEAESGPGILFIYSNLNTKLLVRECRC